MFILFLFFGLFFIILGLFRVRTEIDKNTRQIMIKKTNFRGKSGVYTCSFDDICINGTLVLGVTAGVRKEWDVKAGIPEINTSIITERAYSEKECIIKMLGMYRFFFPDREVTKKNVITNGRDYFVLSDEEMAEFENSKEKKIGEFLDEDEKDSKPILSKWDFLVNEEPERNFVTFCKGVAKFVKDVWG
jgi:hypothetical protein